MIDLPATLTAAAPDDLANALAFALRFDGRKRKHDAAEMMARIVAKRLVEHLERSGFVVMKQPPIGGASALGRARRASCLGSGLFPGPRRSGGSRFPGAALA